MRFALVPVWLVLLLVGAGQAAAQVQSTVTPRAERERIERERAAAEARFTERRRECLTRFIATSCVDDAKRERRQTVTRLRHEQMTLDENERKERAAARTESIRKKTEEAAARSTKPTEGATREPKGPRPDRQPRAAQGQADNADAAASAPDGRPARAGKDLLPAPRTEGPARSAEDAARSRSTFDAAQRAAEEHRAEVEARNAARAAKKKPAAPLPIPPGASAP